MMKHSYVVKYNMAVGLKPRSAPVTPLYMSFEPCNQKAKLTHVLAAAEADVVHCISSDAAFRVKSGVSKEKNTAKLRTQNQHLLSTVNRHVCHAISIGVRAQSSHAVRACIRRESFVLIL